jgi:antitoxin ParD1/3/4
VSGQQIDIQMMLVFTEWLECYEILVTLCKNDLLMKTTSVALGSHFEDFIQTSIMSGRYNNASEVIRSGLRLLEEQEQRMAALRSLIEEGLDSGYVEDFDPEAFLQEMKERKHGKV